MYVQHKCVIICTNLNPFKSESTNAANINLRVKLAYSFLQMSPLNHEAVIMITALEDELESNGLDNFK